MAQEHLWCHMSLQQGELPQPGSQLPGGKRGRTLPIPARIKHQQVKGFWKICWRWHHDPALLRELPGFQRSRDGRECSPRCQTPPRLKRLSSPHFDLLQLKQGLKKTTGNFHMKQHLCAGFVMSRTAQYMFLKRPKQVHSREKLEGRECKPATPQLL